MAGHSKWANIKRTKARVDAQRGKLFSRLAKDIISAARHGGPNPDANIRLKTAIAKAREANMPSDNIDRAIKKATGGSDGATVEEVVYEGYAPGGVAVMIEIVTDNRNRTAADLRHIFSKLGGNLGEAGCVAWMFARKGVIVIDRERCPLDEDALLDAVLEAGAEDMEAGGATFAITTAPDDLDRVLSALEAAGVPAEKAAVELIPSATVSISGEVAAQVLLLLDRLEDHDDVQNVYANCDLPDDEWADAVPD